MVSSREPSSLANVCLFRILLTAFVLQIIDICVILKMKIVMTMKNLIVLVALFVGSLGTALAQGGDMQLESAPAEGSAAVASSEWASVTHDFGTIAQNEPVTTKFEFTNTGGAPMVITNVKGSCGCTVTDYSREPVMPGQQGYVTATYNAKAIGVFNKSITVTSNSFGEPTKVLYIKGEVKPEGR